MQDALVMLNERVSQLEWTIQYLLGPDVQINNGIKVHTNFNSANESDYYLIQLSFKNFPTDLITKAACVAIAINMHSLLPEIQALKEEVRSTTLLNIKLNEKAPLFVMECFSKFNPLVPSALVKSAKLYIHKNDTEYVATWIFEFEQNISIDIIAESIKSGIAGSGFSPLDTSVFVLNKSCTTNLIMPFIQAFENIKKDKLEGIESFMRMFGNHSSENKNIIETYKPLLSARHQPTLIKDIHDNLKTTNILSNMLG